MCVSMCECAWVCGYACVCVCIIHTYTHTCTHIYTYTHLHTHPHTSTQKVLTTQNLCTSIRCVCVYTHVCQHTHTQTIHTKCFDHTKFVYTSIYCVCMYTSVFQHTHTHTHTPPSPKGMDTFLPSPSTRGSTLTTVLPSSSCVYICGGVRKCKKKTTYSCIHLLRGAPLLRLSCPECKIVVKVEPPHIYICGGREKMSHFKTHILAFIIYEEFVFYDCQASSSCVRI